MTSVTAMKATSTPVLAPGRRRAVGDPQPRSTGARSSANAEAPNAADRKPGEGDADLDGGQEAVRVGVQLGDLLAAAAALGDAT